MTNPISKFRLMLAVAFLIAVSSLVGGQDLTVEKVFETIDHQTTRLEYFKGVVKPHRIVELSAKTEGLIKELKVAEGQFVMRNQLLATIEDEAALAALKIAETESKQTGELDRAELEWKIETERFNRLESVVSQNATSELELWEKAAVRDQKKAVWNEALEKQALAKARLDLALAEWNKHRLFAPFEGYIVEIHKKAGTQPKAAEKIITLADLTKLEVELHLPLKYFGELKNGSLVTLLAEQPVSREVVGTVKSISPLVNSTSGTFRCVLTIQNSDQKLPAGFLVSAKLE